MQGLATEQGLHETEACAVGASNVVTKGTPIAAATPILLITSRREIPALGAGRSIRSASNFALAS